MTHPYYAESLRRREVWRARLAECRHVGRDYETDFGPDGATVAVFKLEHFLLVTMVILVVSTASSAAAARIAAMADPATVIRAGES